MHPTTEQLLALRDGLAAAEVRAHVDACSECRAEVESFVHQRDALRALPDIAPPAAAFDRLVAARNATRRRARGKRFFAIAVAASVVMAVALLVVPRPEQSAPMITVNGGVAELAAHSQALDRVLAEVESESGILDLQTAGTIIALEDQIATVDAHLRLANTLEPRSTEELLRQRIALVTALVDVHATQTQYSF